MNQYAHEVKRIGPACVCTAWVGRERLFILAIISNAYFSGASLETEMIAAINSWNKCMVQPSGNLNCSK